MGQAPDSRVMELRRKLLLVQGELPAAQEDHSTARIHGHDGRIEAYMAVLHAMFYARLSGDALASYLSEHIFTKAAVPVTRGNSVYTCLPPAPGGPHRRKHCLVPSPRLRLLQLPARRKSVASSRPFRENLDPSPKTHPSRKMCR